MQNIALGMYGNARFAICRLPQGSRPACGSELSFFAVTPTEVSLICREEDVPSDAEKVDRGYVCLFVEGSLDFSLIGILAGITETLAEVRVPVLAVSTYDTDYLFIRADRLDTACRAFESKGIPISDHDV